jgi:long-chain fatty acid transport protein
VASPDLRFGVSLGSYFGLGLDYGDTWMGRYYVQNAELLSLGVNPSVAYKINDWLSVGGGATVLYGKLTQEAAVNNSAPPVRDPNDGKLKINSEDVGYGYNFGVLLEPGKDTRIGITYRSKIDLKFNDIASAVGVTGPIGGRIAEMINSGNIGLGMTVPQAVTVSAYQQLSDQWAVMANVGWQAWSQFGNVSVDLSTPAVTGSRAINAGFDDTWHGALGAHYRIAEPWLLMAGFAYDTSPVKDENRSAALPLDRQIRYATGVEYTVNKDITVGFAYTFVDLGKAKVNQNRGPLAGNLVGEYSTNYVSAYGLNMNWKF